MDINELAKTGFKLPPEEQATYRRLIALQAQGVRLSMSETMLAINLGLKDYYLNEMRRNYEILHPQRTTVDLRSK